MTSWPTHLLVFGEPRQEPGPLQGYVRKSTACGLVLHNRTWRGWETRAGELSVDAQHDRDSVTCRRCTRTRAYAAAPTRAQLQATYSAQEAK